MAETRTKWPLLFAGTFSYAIMMFAWFSLAAYLAPVISDLGLTDTQAGVVTGAVPLTYVPVALLSGPLIDRVGPYRAIGAGMFVLGVIPARPARSGPDCGSSGGPGGTPTCVARPTPWSPTTDATPPAPSSDRVTAV